MEEPVYKDYCMKLDGKPYYFGFNERYGPLFLTQRAREPTESQKAPSGFWDAFGQWLVDHPKDKTVGSPKASHAGRAINKNHRWHTQGNE